MRKVELSAVTIDRQMLSLIQVTTVIEYITKFDFLNSLHLFYKIQRVSCFYSILYYNPARLLWHHR